MVEFSNREELERWLEGKPRGWAVVVAARAALRVAPLLGGHMVVGTVGVDDLLTFRAVAAAWAAATWPNRRAVLRVAAKTAAGAATATFRTSAVPPAAARTVYGRTFRRAAANAVTAAARAASAGAADIWRATSMDATELETGVLANKQGDKLARRSLWYGDTPIWVDEVWLGLKRALLGLNENWEVWTDWYDERLRGSSAIEELELARVQIDDEIWDQGPKVVNAHIKELIARYEPKAGEPSADRDLLESVPSQGPGPRYRANEEGLLDRAPAAELDNAGNDTRTIDQLRPLVLHCAAELQAHLSGNQYPELLNSVTEYQAAFDSGDGQIEWGEVWGLGVRLQNAAASAERKIGERILPALEDPAKTALDSLLTMHGPMILATADGARLSEAAAGFAMTRQEQQALRDAAERVAEQLKVSPDVITPRAAELLSEAAETIGKGPHPERGSVYGLASIKNV